MIKIAIPVRPYEIDSYANYFKAMIRCGALPQQVGPDADASCYDGILLPGGADVCWYRYCAENRGTAAIDPALDEWQLGALNAFVRAKKPVLGICRGNQLINVCFDGTLVQDVSVPERHARCGADYDKIHASTAVPGSWIAGLYGDSFVTNSSHHQSVENPGRGIVIDSRCAVDGVVEAIHHEALPVWGVQWHPERMCFDFARDDTVSGETVLRWFVEQCRV